MIRDRRRAARDRRGGARVPAVFAVREARAARLAQAQDIGPQGMGLVWPRDAAVDCGEAVALSFHLPGAPGEIAARARVVSAVAIGRLRRTGVRFLALRPEQRNMILRYCARHRQAG